MFPVGALYRDSPFFLMPYKNIPLSKLLINKENDRFEPLFNEKEAVNVMLTKMGSKIYRIAQHILENGLSPKPFYVVPNGDKYLVKEGNRRTTAMKLMAHPNLIDSKKFSQLKKGFTKLSVKYKASPITSIHCYVFNNISEADKWVKIEHTGEQGGIGVVPWDSEQIQRFDIKHGKLPSIEIQTLDFIKSSPYTDDNTLALVDKIKLTNFSRLLSDPIVRNKLGLDLENRVLKSQLDESEIIKGLSRIIKDVANPNFNVERIYNATSRFKYINEIPSEELPDLTKKTENFWPLVDPASDLPNESDQTQRPSKGTKKNNPTNKLLGRKSLIPKTCDIPISNIKVAKIYHELQKINVGDFTNCSAVTLRVFIELSIDTFLEKNDLLPEEKPSSSKSGMNLFQKSARVCDYLSKKKLIDENLSKGIKTITKDANSIWGIDTIQAYLHNNQFSPIAEHVLTTWDNIQEFMVTLWSNIKSEEC